MKQEFSLFNMLPHGVILFKDEKIIYINTFLLEVLNVDFLALDKCVDILLLTLNIEDEARLIDYFNNHEYFIYKEKVIQIEKNLYDEYDVFVFFVVCECVSQPFKALKEKLIEEEKQRLFERNTIKENDFDTRLLEHFIKKGIRKIKTEVFYKGLPLKGISKVIRINPDSLELMIDNKQLLGAQMRNDILLIFDHSEKKSILHAHISEINEKTITVSNFSIMKRDAHLRREIRLKPATDTYLFTDSSKYLLYDISLHGFSLVFTKEEEKEVQEIKSALIAFSDTDSVKLSCNYLKSVATPKGQKAIFNVNYTSKYVNWMREYLTNRQIEIINEVHEFTKKI